MSCQAFEPLIALRNDWAHQRLPEAEIPSRIKVGLDWLEQVLTALPVHTTTPLSSVCLGGGW